MDVGAWLRSFGLGQYELAFRDNAIDGDVLRRLTADDLRDLGVTIVGHRRKLLDAIAALNSAEREPAVRAEAASAPSLTAPSPKSADLAAERRPITVMFCDLVGSTGLAAKLDPEDWRTLVNAYLDEATAAVTGLGGHVLKRLGDGLMALFGYPHAQENDAERAVRAALAIQRGLADINARNAANGRPELSARIGLESGPVVVEATGEVFGEAPNIAARVQAAAEPGSVFITTNVQRQVAGLFVVEERGLYELKGLSTPVALMRIVRASGGRRFGARALTSLVGREEELDLLRLRWERAERGEGQFVQIIGEPGIGKSRLIEEFRLKLGEAPHTFVEWSSSQLLQNTPLHPVADWGRQRFGGAETPAPQRLADLENTLRLIGLDPAEYSPLLAPLVDMPLPEERAAKFAPEELRRRQLAALTTWVLAGARSQPVVLAFEDLHWADPTSLDLMQALAERGAQAPLFILATARPEFQPPWTLRSHHSVISLSPLERGEVEHMVGEIASRHALSKEVVEGVSERAGGVPLFVEEVTRLLLERGEEGGARAIPPTLQQSLAARLDRLGEAREFAQIGAVLGRDFSYALLAAVAGVAPVAAVTDRGSVGGVADPALQSALDRLAGADLLIGKGAGREATYRFKHALIQDAAYDSLLRSRRQALHRRAAEVLRDSAAEPEIIAHHFTQAGLDDLAIEWWGKAGDQALRRSAFQEAIAHLGRAIAMADKTGETGSGAATPSASANQRLKLQTSLGRALMWSRGYGADEARAAFIRARELATAIDDLTERFTVYFGLWTGNLLRGELGLAREIAETFLREAERGAETTERKAGRCLVGLTCLFQGDFVEAQANLVETLSIYDPSAIVRPRFRFGGDVGACGRAYLAVTKWVLGEVGPGRALIEEAVALATEIDHIPTLVNVYFFKAHFEMVRGDAAGVRRTAEILIKLSQEKELTFYSVLGALASAWAGARLHSREIGVAELRQSLATITSQGNKTNVPFYQGLLAEIEAEGDAAGALTQVDAALALASENGEHWSDALLHRLRGEILLKRDPANKAPAEEAFLTAIAVAQQQKARSFELHAALALARLSQSIGRPAEAHAVLAPALEGFAPTREMPEVAEAQALLAALAETEEVKADAAQRQRWGQLQVAYGNALIAARGFGAPETSEAFARARDAKQGAKDAPERLAADFGLWAGSYTRGELPSMRAHAAAFLADVEARPDSPEAGVAHRAQGITHWFAGEFLEARSHLERALALFEPGRDDDLAYRFGMDPGVPPMAYLGFTLWFLGEIDRAVSLVERARARIASLTHAHTLALGTMHAAFFELMRGDNSRARTDTSELARILREHDLRLFRAFGAFLEGWAAADAGALAEGLEGMRCGAQSLREQNALVFDGLIKIVLAEAEARAGNVDRAIATIDEALATAERLSFRAFEPELNRLRGEILLKRDPGNLAAAEEALRTAVAVAQRQGTRSFELRAALSLAKLYQSTARPAEAHAVLAPALEGFTPTPEMPEIAEAQALLECLAHASTARS